MNLLDAGQNEGNQQANNHLDNRDGDVDKFVNDRGSRDAGQHDEYKFKCLQQASFLVMRAMACRTAANIGIAVSAGFTAFLARYRFF